MEPSSIFPCKYPTRRLLHLLPYGGPERIAMHPLDHRRQTTARSDAAHGCATAAGTHASARAAHLPVPSEGFGGGGGCGWRTELERWRRLGSPPGHPSLRGTGWLARPQPGAHSRAVTALTDWHCAGRGASCGCRPTHARGPALSQIGLHSPARPAVALPLCGQRG
jgi:hypothetical protein